MFGHRRRLFRLLGIPIAVDASWLIVLALLTLTMAGEFPDLMEKYYPGAAHGEPREAYWLMGLLAALGFFACIVLHELGHAVVARSHQMPIRGVTLFLFGGVAEIGEEPPSPRAELLMAVAGPAVSVALAALLGALAWLGYRLGWPPSAVLVLGYLAAVNALVLAFNLIPAFPLDGGRVLRSILWSATGDLRRATYWASIAGQGFAWALIFSGVMNFFAGNWLGGIWIGLMGLFLAQAAQSGYQQVLVRRALEGESVGRFMNPDPVAVPPSLDVRTWVEDYVYRLHRKAFPVISDGALKGLIETRALAHLPRGEWGRHTVGELMRRDLETITVAVHGSRHLRHRRPLVTPGR